MSESNIAFIYLSPCLHFGSNQNGRKDFTEKKRNLAFQQLSAWPIDAKKYVNYIENKEIFHFISLSYTVKLIPCHKLQIEKVTNLNTSMNMKLQFIKQSKFFLMFLLVP